MPGALSRGSRSQIRMRSDSGRRTLIPGAERKTKASTHGRRSLRKERCFPMRSASLRAFALARWNPALVNQCRDSLAVKTDGFSVSLRELLTDQLLGNPGRLGELGAVGKHAAGKGIVKHKPKCRNELVCLHRSDFRHRCELVETAFSAPHLQAEELAPPRQFFPIL